MGFVMKSCMYVRYFWGSNAACLEFKFHFEFIFFLTYHEKTLLPLKKEKGGVDISTAKRKKNHFSFLQSVYSNLLQGGYRKKNNIQFYIKFWSVQIRLLIHWLFHFSLLIFDFCCKSKTEVPICIPIISNVNFLLYVYKEKSPSQIANCRNRRNV